MKKKLLPIALFASGSSLFSQTVCTGTVEQCCEAPKQLCANEKAPAKMKCNEQDCFEGHGFSRAARDYKETGL